MKVLIQQNSSLHYYRGGGDWTPERTNGKDFGNALAAIKVVHKESLAHVAILLIFEDSRPDLRLPMDVDRPRPRAQA